MKRIIYVLKSFALKAGTERVMSDKMNYLADHGYDVTLVTYEQGTHPLAFPLHSSIRHVDLDTRFFLVDKYGFLRRFFKKLQLRRQFKNRLQIQLDELHPDILITTTYSIKLIDIILSIKTSAFRLIESHVACYTVKKTYDYRNKPFHRLIAARYDDVVLNKVAKADYFISLTQGDAADWSQYVPNVIVIPNPVTYIPETVIPHNGTSHRIICVGRLHEQKGFDLLIDAFSIVANRCSGWRIDIFGEGSNKEVLERKIRHYNLESSITLNSPISNIYDEYQRSDFLVLSSRYEGFGLVLVEAMSCGIPCVSFKCKYGPEEIIIDGENGLLAENGNVEDLAAKMLWMIEHEEERKMMGKQARKDVHKYEMNVIMTKWDELFKY
ncbi:glycosyltransferase family 4 protein [Xylanibacter brevis]|uniref:glycosyltransferase family 4 protein n=1 Tax=Xylanibacter brevis TaxID=83231 RepID=UPI0005C55B55|nr:glycosyltransferase family 4 protein [Xylanibacter brevis]